MRLSIRTNQGNSNLSGKYLTWIIVLSVILRIAAAIYMGNQVVEFPGTADQITYHTLAVRVLDGHGFTFGENWWPATRAGEPTAHWSFLYVFYLVGVYTLFGVQAIIARLIQAILVGIAHPILAFLIAKRLFNTKVGLITAGLTAIYAYFIYYSGTLMTEPFFITAILGTIYAAIRCVDALDPKKMDPKARFRNSRWLWALTLGLFIASAVLLRQLFLLFVPFLFAWMALRGRKNSILPIIVAGGITMALILPFTAYNYSRFGSFVLLNTNAGYALFWSNHPIYGTQFQPILKSANYYDLIPPNLLQLNEAALDQALMRQGVQFIIDDPVRWIQLSISRIPIFFMFWPSSDSAWISNISRVISFGIFFPFMLYGLLRSFISNPDPLPHRLSSPIFLVYLFVFVYTGIHLLSWALIRYRLPVDALLLIFAGLAFADLGARFEARLKRVTIPNI